MLRANDSHLFRHPATIYLNGGFHNSTFNNNPPQYHYHLQKTTQFFPLQNKISTTDGGRLPTQISYK